MSKWTKEQTDLFIGLFKEQTVLYNCWDPWYKKRECRKRALESIREAISKSRPQTTINEVKMKIRTLRTQYCAEKITAAKFKLNPFCKYVPKLWCYEKLKFLESSEKDGCKIDEIDIQSVEDESNGAMLETNVEQQNPEETLQQFEVQLQDFVNSVENDPLSPVEKPKQYRRTKLLKKRKRLKYETDAALLNYLKTATQDQIVASKNNERVFGEFIATELQRIKSNEIREDVKWEIQLVLRKGIQRALQNNVHRLKSQTTTASISSAQNQSARTNSELSKQQNILLYN